jgi:hypothetical protein
MDGAVRFRVVAGGCVAVALAVGLDEGARWGFALRVLKLFACHSRVRRAALRPISGNKKTGDAAAAESDGDARYPKVFPWQSRGFQIPRAD